MTKAGMRLSGHVCLVTGGGSGIGAGIARAFAEEGADVAIADSCNPASVQSLVAGIEALGRRAIVCRTDVTREEDVVHAVATAEKSLGPLDTLVTCAGISADVDFMSISVDEWDRMISVHLRGTFLAARACYPGMRDRRRGRIITIASQQAIKGSPRKIHYCAAKSGVIGFTKALALEAAPYGVLVNCIAPGPIETPLLAQLPQAWRDEKIRGLPIRRFGRVEEIAPTAVMLASEEGGYYVGQTLSPNGGDVMVP